MDADPISWNVGQGVVESLDMPLDILAELGESRIGELNMTSQRKIGAVNLQNYSRLMNRVVFDLHRLGERVEVGFVRLVVTVRKEDRDHPGRRRAHERL